ncbi:MAG: hypothetical protein M3O86_04960, partial [Actinomycetota bacterium]|nr:hypothetical protein [Actinomycetota bacterium]
GGALGAGVGAAVVAGMFLLSGAPLSWAARIGPEALMAAALGGYLVRLMLYAVLIVVLRPVEAIHGPSLALSAAVLLVAALGWEVRLVSRVPGFFWVDAQARRRPVGSAAGVVYTPDPTPAGAVPAQPGPHHGSDGRTPTDSERTHP